MIEGRRGTSEVLGYVIIFSVVLVSITIVATGGIDSLENARDHEQLDNGVRAFEIFADNTADLYEERAPSRGTEISTGESQIRVGNATTIEISGETTSGAPVTERVEVSPLILRGDNGAVVYEAGAVFRTSRGGGVMTLEPPFRLDRGAPSLVIAATYGQVGTASGQSVLVRALTDNRTVVRGPADDALDDSPTPTISVTSERWEIWQRYFEAHPDAVTDCRQDGTNTVTCELVGGDVDLRIVATYMELEFEL